MAALPPGGTLHMEENANLVSIPIWLYWLQLARAHAVDASNAVLSDEMLDNLSARLAGEEVEPITAGDGMVEMKEAMGAISAAAYAIDGFYGAVKPLVNPLKSNAKRHRQILETLSVIQNPM